MSQTVTHKDIARRLKVSETTVKSYRRKFPDCIPVGSKGKPIRFLPEAVEVCTRIRDYFDLGMSVEEVRARLSEEFPWISLVASSSKKEEDAPGIGGLPKEFLISVSNLAKSMVTLTQQQNSIIERMDVLEKAFEKGFAPSQLPGVDLKGVLEDMQLYLHNALSPLTQLQRLDELENLTQILHQSAGNMAEASQLLRSLADRAGAQTPPAQTGQSVAMTEQPKVVRFPSSDKAAPAQQNGSAQQSGPTHQDPPREFLLKPMVVRTVEGTYIGAGGRSRGRFTLNDLKALLAYGRQPSQHFSLHWEQVGNEWAVTLTQPEAGESGTWKLQLKEAMSQKGVGVVELVQFVDNGRSLHPAEFCSFVTSIAGGN